MPSFGIFCLAFPQPTTSERFHFLSISTRGKRAPPPSPHQIATSNPWWVYHSLYTAEAVLSHPPPTFHFNNNKLGPDYVPPPHYVGSTRRDKPLRPDRDWICGDKERCIFAPNSLPIARSPHPPAMLSMTVHQWGDSRSTLSADISLF